MKKNFNPKIPSKINKIREPEIKGSLSQQIQKSALIMKGIPQKMYSM